MFNIRNKSVKNKLVMWGLFDAESFHILNQKLSIAILLLGFHIYLYYGSGKYLTKVKYITAQNRKPKAMSIYMKTYKTDRKMNFYTRLNSLNFIHREPYYAG